MTQLAAPPTNSLAVWVPRLLWLIAIVHLVYGVVVYTVWPDMVREGLVDTAFADDDLVSAKRKFFLYFQATGIAMLPVAHLAQDRVRATGQVPLYLGLYLLALGVVLCVIEFSGTGAWVILVAAGLALFVSLRSGQVDEGGFIERHPYATVWISIQTCTESGS